MMDKYLNLIFKKIDASLNNEESTAFDMLYQSDPHFVELYEKQINIHKALTNLPLNIAPDNMLENIMQKVSAPKVSYSAKYGSFNGIKFIALGLIGLTIVGVLIAVFLQQNITLESSQSRIASLIGQYLSFDGITTAMTGHLKYAFLLIPALALVWLDLVFRQNKLVYKTIN